MSALEILRLLNTAMKIAEAAGVNYAKLMDKRLESNGDITDEDLQALANDAQAAIDKL